MKSEEIYVKLLLKINKGNTESNIALDKSRFVLIFNECKNRWVEKLLKHKDSILIDSLWELVKEETLLKPVVKQDYVEFTIPTDFYELISTKAKAKQNSCTKELYVREIKNQDKNITSFNQNLKPNFNYLWTYCSLQDKKIRVYKNDFTILSTNIEYYKVIPDIDIEGYIKFDGTLSSNVDIDLSDQYVDQIINLCAEEFFRDFQNTQGLSLSKDRTNSQE